MLKVAFAVFGHQNTALFSTFRSLVRPSSTAQYCLLLVLPSTVQYSQVQLSTAQYTPVHNSPVQPNTAKKSQVQPITVQYCPVKPSKVQYILLQPEVAQYSPVEPNKKNVFKILFPLLNLL